MFATGVVKFPRTRRVGGKRTPLGCWRTLQRAVGAVVAESGSSARITTDASGSACLEVRGAGQRPACEGGAGGLAEAGKIMPLHSRSEGHAVQVARAFFQACTKVSEDSEVRIRTPGHHPRLARSICESSSNRSASSVVNSGGVLCQDILPQEDWLENKLSVSARPATRNLPSFNRPFPRPCPVQPCVATRSSFHAPLALQHTSLNAR